MTDRPTLGFVGPGRVGWALARAARSGGYVISGVAGGAPEARQRLAAALGARAVPDPVQLDGDVLLLTVPDAALPALAPAIRTHSEAHLVHTAGALPADALGVGRVGTFHPLRSFVGEPRDVELRGCGVAVEADSPELTSLLDRLAGDLGMLPLHVPAADRPRYHAAAVLAGNAPVALLDLARRQLTALGLEAELAGAVLTRLLASVTENAAAGGPDAALSGPVRRGDAETIRRHLAALAEAGDERAASVYAVLAAATLDLAQRLPDGPHADAVAAIRAALDDARLR